MSKKELLNFILFPIIVAIVYVIWAIQPLPFDDWCITKLHTLFSWPQLPETGQQIRSFFGGMSFFTTNPFSFFKAWSLLTAIVATSLLWAALINESMLMRAGLTLLVVLGFPYLGHIGPWNFAASAYTVSVVWMMLWYIVYRKIRHANIQSVSSCVLLFLCTFIAASWHEVWLVSFFAIVIYVIFDAFFIAKKQNQPFKLGYFIILISIISAYILSVAFYTRGGTTQFIDKRLGTSNLFAELLNWQHLIKTFLLGTKENLVLLRDGLPIFLLIIYIKLNKNFKTNLSLDFKLFLSAALGTILFTYVLTFIRVPDWRVRCLCLLPLSFALYALPNSMLNNLFGFARRDYLIKVVRIFSIVVAVIWLSYNAYRTYVYTNIDVAGWLQYRQMVLERNPDVLKRVCCSTLPKNRPKGVANWEHAWGAQDDKYRFFIGPADSLIGPAVKAIWDDESTKRSFIY